MPLSWVSFVIVGLFDDSSAHLKDVFSYAIAYANDQQGGSVHLQGTELDVDRRDSVFQKSKKRMII